MIFFIFFTHRKPCCKNKTSGVGLIYSWDIKRSEANKSRPVLLRIEVGIMIRFIFLSMLIQVEEEDNCGFFYLSFYFGPNLFL